MRKKLLGVFVPGLANTSKGLILLLAALFVAQPLLALAGPSANIIPAGKVTILDGGKPAGQIQSEMPLPEGKVLQCDGRCVVQAVGFQIVAQNKTKFSVADKTEYWDVGLLAGKVDFSANSDIRPLVVHAGKQVVRISRADASQVNGIVRGSIALSSKGAVMSIQEGAVQVATARSAETVQAGQSILLADGSINRNAEAVAAAAAEATTVAAAEAAAGGAGVMSGATALGGAALAAGAVGAALAIPGNDGIATMPADVSPY